MYIGEVAKKTGASPKAIRLYESMGLFPEIDRKGKYRVFTDEAVEIIHVIKLAQHLGFKLAEIKALQLAEDASCTAFPWEKASILVREKIESNREEIKRIRQQNIELTNLTKMLDDKACAES